MYDRIEKLIGKDNLDKINQKHILIVGLGGVGGTAFEALIRSGFLNFTIVDNDKFEISNLNRQILCLRNDLGKNKVDVAKIRTANINDNIKVNCINDDINNINLENINKIDYIIDACDDIKGKKKLIKFANDNQINIISALGMGKRIDPTKVIITRLDKTHNCPLAKKLRYELRSQNISIKIPVVFSEEIPKNNNNNIVSSCIFVPSVAGLYLASYVFNDIIQ